MDCLIPLANYQQTKTGNDKRVTHLYELKFQSRFRLAGVLQFSSVGACDNPAPYSNLNLELTIMTDRYMNLNVWMNERQDCTGM